MRGYFLSLVHESLGMVDPDPRRFLEALRRALDQVRAGNNPLDEGGLVALLASPEQHEMLQKVQGLMSLLEGHGDITMNRAAAEAVPSAERFARVLRDRRRAVKGFARQLQRLIGLEAKLAQYEQGERFIETVEKERGTEVLDLVWQGPEWLPSLPEIRQPDLWLTRAEQAQPAPS
jgi:putative hydrolase